MTIPSGTSDPKRYVFLMHAPRGWAAVKADNSADVGPDVTAFLSHAEGAPVLDLTGVDPMLADFLTRMGPKPDASLKPGEHRSMLPPMKGPDGQTAITMTSMDRIAIDLWIQAWVDSVPEARTGSVRGGAITWDATNVRPTQAPALA